MLLSRLTRKPISNAMTRCEQILPGAWQSLGQCTIQGEYRSSIDRTLCDEHWVRLTGILDSLPVFREPGMRRLKRPPNDRFGRAMEQRRNGSNAMVKPENRQRCKKCRRFKGFDGFNKHGHCGPCAKLLGEYHPYNKQYSI